MTLALLQFGAIALLVVLGPIVVATRDPRAQVLSLTAYGLCLALLFMVFQAPDVALAQVVVGAVAVPLMVLLALARMRRALQLAEADARSSKGMNGDDGGDGAR